MGDETQAGHVTQSGPISFLSQTFGFVKGTTQSLGLHVAGMEAEEWTQLLRAAVGSEERKALLDKERGMKPVGREERR